MHAAAAKLLQSCPTLCDPIDGSPPGSPIPGILQAWTLEWVAISFSNAWKWKVKVKSFSCVLLLATPWTAANQPPPSMGFSRQEYWSWVPLWNGWAHTKTRCWVKEMKKESESKSHSVLYDSFWHHGAHGIYSPWNSSGQNTSVGKPFPSAKDIPFSRGSSQPRSWTQVSHITGQIL